MAIDLRLCKLGDRLLSRHGALFEYIAPVTVDDWCGHVVRHASGLRLVMTDNGFVSQLYVRCDSNGCEIVAILG